MNAPKALRWLLIWSNAWSRAVHSADKPRQASAAPKASVAYQEHCF